MEKNDIKPDGVSYITAIGTALRMQDFSLVDKLLDEFKEKNFHFNGLLYKELITAYMALEDEEKVNQLWSDFKKSGLNRSHEYYNFMIQASFKFKRYDEALSFFKEAKEVLE